MSSVMRPVGPEPQETYWVRRAVVIGTALVLMIILLLVLFNLNGGQQPAPAATPNPLPPFSSVTPTPSPTPSEPSASPSVSGSASASSSSASGSASASSSASSSASGSASSGTTGSVSASPTAGASGSAKASDQARTKSTGAGTSKAKPSSTPTTSTQKTLTVCDPNDLATSVRSGSRTATVKKPVAFTVSLVNRSSANCVVTVNAKDFSLKVYSGRDRIWSTADCPALVKDQLAQVGPRKALTWTVTWNGRRSAAGCKTRPETPRAGYYWATASFTGTDPARARLVLTS